jgi:hypothetical protein
MSLLLLKIKSSYFFGAPALRAKKDMATHPDETCPSAAAQLNLNRKRASKLLLVIRRIPQSPTYRPNHKLL